MRGHGLHVEKETRLEYPSMFQGAGVSDTITAVVSALTGNVGLGLTFSDPSE